jgi:hypothetical protein
MATDEIVRILQENQADLRRHGIKTLILIGSRTPPSPVEKALEFLAELFPPLSYQHFLEARQALAVLLDHPVDITLANSADPAVRPFLDPDAIYIL